MLRTTTSSQSSQGVLMKHQTIEPIQWLRGIAAMMVVWFHSATQLKSVEHLIEPTSFGATGVAVFFVISGFIMVVTTQGETATPANFLMRRVIRIVPLYWTVTLAAVLGSILLPSLFHSFKFTASALIKSLLFIPYRSLSFPAFFRPVLLPGWTLNYEMFFYALFGLALFLPRAFRVVGLGVVFVALVCWGMVTHVSFYTEPLILQFVFGAVVGQVWLNAGLKVNLGLSLACIALGFTLLELYGDNISAESAGAVLVVIGSLNSSLNRLSCRQLRLLGDASYCIYLTNLFALGLVRALWAHIAHRETMITALAFMGAGAVCSVGLGIAGHLLIEKPMSAYLQTLIGRLRVVESVPRAATSPLRLFGPRQAAKIRDLKKLLVEMRWHSPND
jgi:exopolysaccharide production protein ExoZ